MVEVGTGGSGSKFLRSDYPFTEGIVAGTTKQSSESPYLEAENDIRNSIDKEGL